MALDIETVRRVARLARLEEPEQLLPLLEQRGLGRVEILGEALSQQTSSKPNNMLHHNGAAGSD